MFNLRFYCAIIIVLFIEKSFAQQNCFKTFNFQTINFFTKSTPLLFANTNFIKVQNSLQNIEFKPKKLPVFCQMEVNIYKHLNVWILFRAGSDEEYKKLINSRY